MADEGINQAFKLYESNYFKPEQIYYENYTQSTGFSNQSIWVLFSPSTWVMTIHYFTFPKFLHEKRTVEAWEKYVEQL